MLPAMRALLEDGPLKGKTVEVEAVEGRPPSTIEVPDGKGGICRYCLAPPNGIPPAWPLHVSPAGVKWSGGRDMQREHPPDFIPPRRTACFPRLSRLAWRGIEPRPGMAERGPTKRLVRRDRSLPS